MITCEELTTAIASDELAAAGWRKRLSARFHLLMCEHCRCYQQQIETLGGVVRKLSGKKPEPSRDLEEAIVTRCLEGCEKLRDAT